MSRDAPTILVDHRSAAGPLVTQVRGSLIVSSLQTLRALNLFDAYIQLLSREMHEPVLYALASTWLPVATAMAHYEACEALGLDEAALEAMGKHVGQRITGTFLATLVRGARAVGATGRPVAVLRNYDRMWERIFLGGGCTVTQTGPKDATIESRGIPMLRYRYFRAGYAALIRGAAELVGRAVYVKVLRAGDSSLVLGASWV
jgi:hypothetical protein